MSVTPDEASTTTPPGVELDLSARIARAAPLQRTGVHLSRNAVLAMVAGFAVVGAAAGVVDNYLGAHVGATASSATTASSTPTAPSPASTGAANIRTASTLPTAAAPGLAGLLGLVRAHGPAPGFRLVDEQGHPVSLASLRGRAVVLSFFDADCRDICPVLASELRGAERDLGTAASSVTFLTVNSDPLLTGTTAAAEGARTSRLGGPAGLSNWHFLSGTLPQLDAVWERYGITVDVQRATGAVSHNDAMWFIRPSGTVAYEATPFADERRATATFHLPAATERRFAAGIARYARDLLPAPSPPGGR